MKIVVLVILFYVAIRYFVKTEETQISYSIVKRGLESRENCNPTSQFYLN